MFLLQLFFIHSLYWDYISIEERRIQSERILMRFVLMEILCWDKNWDSRIRSF